MYQSSESQGDSIEEWFFQSAIKASECSIEPAPGKKPCPGYYKVLAAAADWHVISILFSAVLILMFISTALKEND